MRSINKVILVGNLTRNPELRQTNNGQNVTTFGLATNREWMTRDKERKNSAEFHECVAWAKLADICDQYLTKGNLVYVEGYLKTRSWDSEEGIKKFKTEIVVKDMIKLEKRSQENNEKSLDFIPTEDTTEENNTTETNEIVSENNLNMESSETEEVSTPVETVAASTNSEEENPIDKDLGL